MKNVLLPAKVLSAARLCEGKGDVRYYLNGVYIDKNRIAATNGHVLFCCSYSSHTLDSEHQGDQIDDPVILQITGNVPAKSYRAYFTSINEKRGFIEYTDSIGNPVGYGGFSVIDGNYPDIDQHLKPRPAVPVSSIGINNQYLALNAKISKLLCSRDYAGGKLEFYGQNELVKIVTSTPDYGDVTLIVMPMRL